MPRWNSSSGTGFLMVLLAERFSVDLAANASMGVDAMARAAIPAIPDLMKFLLSMMYRFDVKGLWLVCTGEG